MAPRVQQIAQLVFRKGFRGCTPSSEQSQYLAITIIGLHRTPSELRSKRRLLPFWRTTPSGADRSLSLELAMHSRVMTMWPAHSKEHLRSVAFRSFSRTRLTSFKSYPQICRLFLLGTRTPDRLCCHSLGRY